MSEGDPPFQDIPREVADALAAYEAAVMGTLVRLPNHWQQYRDLLEIGPDIQAARRLGREALERKLNAF